MDTIILASGSPRRSELLARARIPFKVIAPDAAEDYTTGGEVRDLVMGIARRKVEAILNRFKAEAPRWILGVDTVVELDGAILGKPGGIEEAESMIRMLAGKTHRVVSGMALLVERGRPLEVEYTSTDVSFREMSSEEVGFYLETGEWAGAAGGYRIQERGAFFIEGIRGSYSNVVGLPLEAFYGMLKRNSYLF